MSSGRFYELDDNDQLLDETELFINLSYDQNLTESDTDTFNNFFQLEYHIQNQELNDSGWLFDKIDSMKTTFC